MRWSDPAADVIVRSPALPFHAKRQMSRMGIVRSVICAAASSSTLIQMRLPRRTEDPSIRPADVGVLDGGHNGIVIAGIVSGHCHLQGLDTKQSRHCHKSFCLGGERNAACWFPGFVSYLIKIYWHLRHSLITSFRCARFLFRDQIPPNGDTAHHPCPCLTASAYSTSPSPS
jgi:hypothetical protein